MGSLILDTSVWIEHFKKGNQKVTHLLKTEEIVIHPFILGELTLGQFDLKTRFKILDMLNLLVKIEVDTHDEIIRFVEKNKLMGRGIGWIDCHLLFSAVKNNLRILTFDKKLKVVADIFDCHFY
jgi:predicted nucleic acid-binding protein